MDKQIRAFVCENGHVQGQIQQRVLESGRHVLVLEHYRNAVDLQAETPCEIVVGGVVLGEYLGRCNVPGCGATWIWDPGWKMLLEFVDRWRKRRVHETEVQVPSRP